MATAAEKRAANKAKKLAKEKAAKLVDTQEQETVDKLAKEKKVVEKETAKENTVEEIPEVEEVLEVVEVAVVKAPVSTNQLSAPFENFKTVVETQGLVSRSGADAAYSLIESVRIAVGKSPDAGVELLQWIKTQFKDNENGYLSAAIIGGCDIHWTRGDESRNAYFALIAVYGMHNIAETHKLDKRAIASQFTGKYELLGAAIANQA